jgi:leucyl aminopeptidase
MQTPELESAPDNNLESLVAEDEALLVLAGEGQDTPAVRALIERASPAMRRDHHYASLHFGFLRDGGRAPYAVLQWKPEARGRWQSALERRYVGQKLVDTVRTAFPVKKIAAYLSREAADAAHMAIAEDIFTKYASPLYETSSLTSFRLLSPASEALRRTDPHQKVRLARQVEFRAWVNENPDSLTSIALGDRLQAFCKKQGCGFESFDEKQLAEMGMNLLVAVGQASTRSPSRLLLATHRVKPGDKPLLLVGKGITFDTGGINLKPHESFVNCMKNDMGGAGLMIQLFMALVESGYDGPLALAIPACENLIAERSFKPGAVIRSYAGKKVIIEHTDAEGRLILADALHYAQKKWSPAYTLMAATLTTASLRQFTNWFTPVHFAKPAFRAELEAAGAAWGEGFTFWDEFLPFLEGNKSAAADLTNMGRMPSHASMGGGSNVAAHFLRQFAVAPLAHLDIFASTWNWSGDYPGAHYGATGAPFNALFRALRQPANGAWVTG